MFKKTHLPAHLSLQMELLARRVAGKRITIGPMVAVEVTCGCVNGDKCEWDCPVIDKGMRKKGYNKCICKFLWIFTSIFQIPSHYQDFRHSGRPVAGPEASTLLSGSSVISP